MVSELPTVSGNFGIQLIDDIFTLNTSNNEEDEKAGDIFEKLFRTISKSENTQENSVSNVTNPIHKSTFGPPFGMKMDGFDYVD
ncbi:hypothetical protein IJG72_02530 [bacterium]|nr:hypothetical protein [bacterium]